MKVKILLVVFAILSAVYLPSCNSAINPLGNKETPNLFPIYQNGKFGYINRKGEVVIQPQFARVGFFSEGLAAACLEYGKCGFIDATGKFVVNPQFEYAANFSEGLAVVIIEKKVGYIDKAGKTVINPQFSADNADNPGPGGEMSIYNSFSEGLASVRIGDKYGFIDKEGKIIINPQFELAFPFSDGLSVISMGSKSGFIDKEGKIVINPQFDRAFPFTNGLAVVQVGKQFGYIDKTGKIIINPQFDTALPFSENGLAKIVVGDKVGFIDKEGKYVINPQFAWNNSPASVTGISNFMDIYAQLPFSEGLESVKVGNSVGYIDKTGKIIINPQFNAASQFYGGLALVNTDSGLAYIDKEGKYVWRETKETPKTQSNKTSTSNSVSNTTNPSTSNTSSTSSQNLGRLTTDSNIRSESNKDATSLGIHFKGARVEILEEKTTIVNGESVMWYNVKVIEYGCSVNANIGCGKNNPNDADEGWVNAKNVLLDFQSGRKENMDIEVKAPTR